MCFYFFSLKLECEKLASDKTDMQRAYVMVSLTTGVVVNPLQPGVVFLYPLKTSKNLRVFWCFQGV